jgi:hypothetical protein
VEVQVLAVLVSAEVRQDPALPVFVRDLGRDVPDHRHGRAEQHLAAVEVDQRRDAAFGDDDDVDRV